MTLVLHFMPLVMKLTVQYTGDTFPNLTDSNYLTKHITLKLFPLLQLKGAYLCKFTTGIFTRVDYLRINKFNLP